ncbi:hypothetical protein [Ideonella sp.]|uniref:hypothetical protein n=1 Tax=Ideonella sp. TaxID=1929293 RepID=UPI0035AE3C64
MNVRALAKRRQATRLHYASQREAEFFARVRRQVARSKRRAHAAFHARGDRAWQQYLRDRRARSLDDVFAAIDARVDARRRETKWSVGAELAKGATSVRFPPAPEPQEWDWEPPRLELPLKPADLDD